MATHPDLAAEQAYIDHAYESLEHARRTAMRLRTMVEVGRGGTEQARWEREMIEENIAQRLEYLDVGDASLVFGRIDKARSEGGESYYIGRIAVSDESQEPLVVDWRAPVAEPFYRATGRSPMGLVRRRHFATRGRKLLGIEDELFGEGAQLLGVDGEGDGDDRVRGRSSLIAALEESRSGKLSDIVATIQGEQDEVIRAPLPGVLVVQGGPGTGKTVVALHRAAYLLYTYRFPLEGQGVLVVGPNRLFLGYIERVLPSLGEAGVELAVLADLVDGVRVRGRDRPATARVKGDARMAKVLAKAVRDRERPLRAPLRVPFGAQTLVLPPERTTEIVAEARRRFRLHNPARKFVEKQLFAALAEVSRVPTTPEEVRERTRSTPEVREALERMWPVLTPAELLHDLFGSKALIELAARRYLDPDERAALHRPRSEDVAGVVWTHDDVPLLDEARALLGPRRRRRSEDGTDPDEIRTYGHIVVDEAQDLSPMQLRMLARRSLNGSMTVVGDIAQATGVWAHRDWDDILEHLPRKRPSQRAELSIGYRIPGPTMDLAAKVLAEAAPNLRPPDSVRTEGDEPRLIAVGAGELAARVAEVAAEERDVVDPGSVAVIAPSTLVEDVAAALDAAGVEFGRAARNGLEQRVTLVPVSLVKGLELDAAVVVEPAAIVEEEAQGMRALYVALTRATKRLAVVHARELPEPLR
ncbi:MAG: UvrD-helicase domain-containing protein [Acidimicrobiia bacterium]